MKHVSGHKRIHSLSCNLISVFNRCTVFGHVGSGLVTHLFVNKKNRKKTLFTVIPVPLRPHSQTDQTVERCKKTSQTFATKILNDYT